MRVTVLGSGNGGLATAFDFAQHGHEVTMCDLPGFGAAAEAVAEAGGITAAGDLTGFAPVTSAGHDIGAAVDGAELLILVGPAYATVPMAEAVRAYLRPELAVLVCPASCAGALTFVHAVGMDPRSPSLVVGETSTLPYAVRITGPATIQVFLKLRAGVFLAALPRSGTSRLHELTRDVWPTEPVDSVLQTTLQNGNPVIHPAVTLLNAALIERTHGGFLFYEEGVTPASGRLIEAVDRERLAIADALGVEVLSEPELGMRQGYMTENNYSTAYSEAPGFLGISAQSQLDNRYLTEDVGYSLVFLTDLAGRLGVPTPNIDACVTIASTILGRDFRAESARTLDSLGMGDASVAELRAL